MHCHYELNHLITTLESSKILAVGKYLQSTERLYLPYQITIQLVFVACSGPCGEVMRIVPVWC